MYSCKKAHFIGWKFCHSGINSYFCSINISNFTDTVAEREALPVWKWPLDVS